VIVPILSVYDVVKLERIADAQHHVITRRQAIGCGMPSSTVENWVLPAGKWRKILPGIYSTVTGKPTVEQQQMAALLYAGPKSVITGPAAIRLHRLRSPGPDLIDVLVPWTVKRQSMGFVRIHRTRRMPAYYRTGPIRYARAARAIADAAHGFTALDDVRVVVAEGIQKQACSIAEIVLELEEGSRRDSSHLRMALTEVRDGIRSVAEARFRQRVQRSDLPQPMFNVFLRRADGTDIGEVDAWWADAGVSVEIDSQEYHFYREGWLRTDAKRSWLLKHGIFPHNIAPTRIDNDWGGIYEELKSSIHQGRQRPRLPIVAFEALG
jgi:hypothetical protein